MDEGHIRDLNKAKRLEVLLNASVDGILVHEHGRIVFVNDAMEVLFKYGYKELKQLNVTDIMSPIEDISLLEHVDTDADAILDVEGKRKDGSTFLLQLFSRNMYYDDRSFRAIVCRNVTSQRRTEYQLLRKEREYRTLFEDSNDAIYISSREGNLVKVNQAAVEMLGYSREELLKINSHNLYYNNRDRMKFQLEIEIHGSVKDYEVQLKRKDGSPIDCLLSSTVRLDQSKEIAGYQGVIRDVTAIRSAERLRKEKDRIEQKTKLKSEFLANMSHEIRTPMNAIFGIANLLQDTRLNASQSEYVGLIKKSADHLLALINDILDFSKIEAGKVELEYTEINLRELLHNVFVTVNFKDKAAHVDYLKEIDDDIPDFVLGDSVRLSQILINLLSNAIKFTEIGHVRLLAHLLESDKKSVTIRFVVEDTGIGIPPKKLNSIFESFTQAANSTTRLFGGTGLGLSITKHLVKLYKGDIKVESQEGLGSQFIVDIPFKTIERKATDVIQKDEVEINGTFESMRILVMEDNRLNQIVAKKTLQRWGDGMDVVIANNGAEGIEILKNESFDLIISDVQMPEMDGHQATEYIRTKMVEPKRNIPILAMTAFATKSDAEKCIRVGMNDYVTKPFEPQELLSKIIKLTGKKFVPNKAIGA